MQVFSESPVSDDFFTVPYSSCGRQECLPHVSFRKNFLKDLEESTAVSTAAAAAAQQE